MPKIIEYPKLEDIHEGDLIEYCESNCDCLPFNGIHIVRKNEHGELYIRCSGWNWHLPRHQHPINDKTISFISKIDMESHI